MSCILIEASEESGSPDLAAHLVNLRERIGTPRLVICLDSGGLSYDRLWLTTSLRGVLVADVRVDVLTEGIHSGQGGGVVPSSFRILRRILSNIEDEATGRILLPELAGRGSPRPTGPTSRHWPVSSPRAPLPSSKACTCSRPIPSTGSSPARGGPRSRSRAPTACPNPTTAATCCDRRPR